MNTSFAVIQAVVVALTGLPVTVAETLRLFALRLAQVLGEVTPEELCSRWGELDAVQQTHLAWAVVHAPVWAEAYRASIRRASAEEEIEIGTGAEPRPWLVRLPHRGQELTCTVRRNTLHFEWPHGHHEVRLPFPLPEDGCVPVVVPVGGAEGDLPLVVRILHRDAWSCLPHAAWQLRGRVERGEIGREAAAAKACDLLSEIAADAEFLRVTTERAEILALTRWALQGLHRLLGDESLQHWLEEVDRHGGRWREAVEAAFQGNSEALDDAIERVGRLPPKAARWANPRGV